MQTRDQRYAATIFKQVEYVQRTWPAPATPGESPKPSPEQEEYGGMAHRLPVLVRTAGLAQALAFVKARGKPRHHLLLHHLALAVLPRETEPVKDNQESTIQILSGRSRAVQLGAYMYLTGQVLDALLWYKRFAESVLDVGSEATDATTDPAQ